MSHLQKNGKFLLINNDGFIQLGLSASRNKNKRPFRNEALGGSEHRLTSLSFFVRAIGLSNHPVVWMIVAPLT
jgi:hypothetical protein